MLLALHPVIESRAHLGIACATVFSDQVIGFPHRRGDRDERELHGTWTDRVSLEVAKRRTQRRVTANNLPYPFPFPQINEVCARGNNQFLPRL